LQTGPGEILWIAARSRGGAAGDAPALSSNFP
jgi:hypothetical protein